MLPVSKLPQRLKTSHFESMAYYGAQALMGNEAGLMWLEAYATALLS